MEFGQLLRRQFRVSRRFTVPFVSIVVGANGLFILANTLLDQMASHHGSPLTAIVIDVPLMVGLSLIYLSSQLRRRKRTAWFVTILAYSFYLGIGLAGLLSGLDLSDLHWLLLIRLALLPGLVLALLYAARREFIVQSDIGGFRSALLFSVIVLTATFVYGVVGFSLLDKHDFHQEVSVGLAAHYTIDQFDLTTRHPLHPYTRRSRLFVNSLSFVSVAAVVYVALALFQPIRLRFSDQPHNRRRMAELLHAHPPLSEEYFKLWPHDKHYFFDDHQQAGLAYRVHRGIAICLGDPAGDPRAFSRLLRQFDDLCYGNGWQPALVHITGERRRLYERHDFTLQKIGQEAVVDLEQFQMTVRNKYFRHIRNKFDKQGYRCELLSPPHDTQVLQRLRAISDQWLSVGGRSERGFAMGYYTDTYMQRCPVMVTRDGDGQIQAFMNLLPADFDHTEANFDLLRHATGSQGNINDYLLMHLAEQLRTVGYQRLNLGLCPLTGLDDAEQDERGLIGGLLRFAYANGDRFYSFSGLYRFKSKYEPAWRDRFIAYQGNIGGFSRTMNALVAVMRVKPKS